MNAPDGPLPGSPRAARLAAPSWLDARLVLGVLLVLVSVVAGARVLSAADRTELVWAAATDVAPGAALRAEDLRPAEVLLQDAAGAYLDATQAPPVGYVVQRGLLDGELVPRRALKEPAAVEYRQVTVNVEAGHAPPDLDRGDLVDVYVTPTDGAGRPVAPQGTSDGADGADGADRADGPDRSVGSGEDPVAASGSAGSTSAGGTRRVLQRVAVASVPAREGFAAGSEVRAVVLNVLPADVLTVVRASAEGTVDLVRLPVDGLARAEPVTAAG